MVLAKLHIKPQSPDLEQKFGPDGIEVLFNPNSYTINKNVTWTPVASSVQGLNAPPLDFGGGGLRTLSLELFLDVTEGPADDVRVETNKLVALTRIDRGLTPPRPPVCVVSWGAAPAGSDFPFTGVVSMLRQNFTLFAADGKPLRATATINFTEYLTPEDDQRKTDPELTTHVVTRGDTLSRIAAQAYRDPARWRIIAEANQIDDPRRLEIGARLIIPKIG